MFASDEFEEGNFLFGLGCFLLVLQEVDALVVHFFVFASHLLLAIQKGTLLLLGQLVEESWTPLDVEDCLLEGVLCDDFSDEVPDLVTLFSSEQYEAA